MSAHTSFGLRLNIAMIRKSKQPDNDRIENNFQLNKIVKCLPLSTLFLLFGLASGGGGFLLPRTRLVGHGGGSCRRRGAGLRGGGLAAARSSVSRRRGAAGSDSSSFARIVSENIYHDVPASCGDLVPCAMLVWKHGSNWWWNTE